MSKRSLFRALSKEQRRDWNEKGYFREGSYIVTDGGGGEGAIGGLFYGRSILGEGPPGYWSFGCIHLYVAPTWNARDLVKSSSSLALAAVLMIRMGGLQVQWNSALPINSLDDTLELITEILRVRKEVRK